MCYSKISILIYFVGNSEAGWKFWKKDKETTTTTTTTTPTSIQPVTTPTKATIVGGPTVPATNTGTIVTGANSGIGVDGARQNARNNVRPNRPNPGTEVGLDIPVSRPNRPGIGGNGQNYRDWAVDLTGAGEPVNRNQPSRTPAQGLATNGDSQPRPNSPTGHHFVYIRFLTSHNFYVNG